MIDAYLNELSNKFDIADKITGRTITKEDLWKIWDGNSVEIDFSDEEQAFTYLSKCKAADLKQLCREKKLDNKGCKYHLITRLMNFYDHDVTEEEIKSMTSRKSSPKKKQKNKNERILRKHPKFTDYFWHPSTNFMMLSKKEGVVGKISERSGKTEIVTLNQEDYDLAMKWKFPVLNGENYEN
jgi:hypothetical protein